MTGDSTCLRLLDKNIKPGEEMINNVLGETAAMAWKALQQFVESNYDFTAETYFYGAKYGWTIRYRKSGKTLCSFFPENGAFTVLIVLGGQEVKKVMDVIHEFTPKVRQIIENTTQYHDGKWLWIRIFSSADTADIIELIKIKKKPKLLTGK